MSGVYEPGLEVGNSALFPLATPVSQPESTERETGECNSVVSPERNYMNVVTFPHRVLLFT